MILSSRPGRTDRLPFVRMSQASRRFCFLTERQVGIGSAAQAIEPYVIAKGHDWCNVTYVKQGGLLERIPVFRRGTGTLRGFLQVREALQRDQHAGLLFLTQNPAVFQWLALEKHPTVLWTDVTPQQLDGQAEQYGHPVDRWEPLRAVKRKAVQGTFDRARFVVGWSNWVRTSLIEDYGLPPEKTRVVHPGVDLTKWHPAPPPSDDELPRILFVGGNFARKGGQLLLEVFREHFRGRCTLDLVTRDDVAPEEGVRVHRGLQAGTEPLIDLYRKASLFVLPTEGDCFSIASLEAMAMGLPVVVSKVGGIDDIVEPGQSGYLLPPRDGNALRESIEQALASPSLRRSMGARGRWLVENKFDAEQTAQALLRLLEEASASPS